MQIAKLIILSFVLGVSEVIGTDCQSGTGELLDGQFCLCQAEYVGKIADPTECILSTTEDQQCTTSNSASLAMQDTLGIVDITSNAQDGDNIDFTLDQEPVVGRRIQWISLGNCNISTENTQLSTGIIGLAMLPMVDCKNRFLLTVSFQECFNDGRIERTSDPDGEYWLFTGALRYGFITPIPDFIYQSRQGDYRQDFSFKTPRKITVTVDDFDTTIYSDVYHPQPDISVHSVTLGKGTNGTSTIVLRSVLISPFSLVDYPVSVPFGKYDSVLGTRNIPSELSISNICEGNNYGLFVCIQYLTFTVQHNGHCSLDGIYLFKGVPVRCPETWQPNQSQLHFYQPTMVEACPSSFLSDFAISLDSPVICNKTDHQFMLGADPVAATVSYYTSDNENAITDAGAVSDVDLRTVFPAGTPILLEYGLETPNGWVISDLLSLSRRIKECAIPRKVVTGSLTSWALLQGNTMFRGFLTLDDDVTCSRNDATVTLIFKFKFVKVVRRRNAESGRLYDQRIELIREFASDSSINDAQRTRSVLYAMREAEDEWFMSMYTDTETAYKYGDEHRLIQSHFGGDNVNYAALFEDFVDSEQEEYDSYVAAGLEHSVYEQMVAATPKTASASRRSHGSVPDYQISTPPLYRSRRDEGSGEGSGPLDVGNGTETPEGGNAILVPVVGSVAITSFSKGLTKYSTSTLKFKTVLEPPYAIDQTLDWTAEVSDHWDEGSTGQQPLPAAAVISPATCSGNITCVQTWTVDIDHAMACQLQGGYKFMDVYTRCQDNLPNNTECEAVNYFTFQINITDINVCEKTETFVDDVYSMAITADRDSIIYDDEMDYTLSLTELASLGQYMDAITIQSITSTADGCAPDVDIMPQTSIVHNPGALTATITIDFTSNVACADPGLGLTSMVTLDFVIDVDYSFNSARRRRQLNGRNAAATGHLQTNILVNGRSSWGSEIDNEIELPAEEDESGTTTTYSPHQPITLALMVCATAVLLAR